MTEPNQTADSRTQHLRALTKLAIEGVAGIAPFVLGTGCDGHGEPLPNAEATIGNALDRLVEAGRLAQGLKEGGCA